MGDKEKLLTLLGQQLDQYQIAIIKILKLEKLEEIDGKEEDHLYEEWP